MALTPQPQQPSYNSLNFGVAADGATDDTAAWNALFALVVTNGGGTIYLPGGRTSLCTGSLVPFPWVNSTGAQVPLRLSGVAAPPGDLGYTISPWSSVLNLQYNGSNTWILNITATGGTYTLTYNSVTTGSITYNNTAAQVQTALNAISGGAALRVSGTFPTYIINVAPLTLTVQTGSLTGGSATLANPIAKIDNRQHGQFEIDHLTLYSAGTDDFLFYQATNTATYAHDLQFQGHTAHSGASCVQDAMYFGGTGTGINTGAATDRFQGYSTRMDRVFFDNIRTGFRLQTSANAIVANDCIWSSNCGGDTTHGAITIVSTNSGSGAATGNKFANNLIEVGNGISTVNYPYAVVLGTNAIGNTFIGTGLFDYVTGCSTVSDASANTGNRFYGTNPAPDTPDTMSRVTLTSGTSFVLSGPNGNYLIECVGAGASGGGGSGAAAGCGGAGGGAGATSRQPQALVNGTTYTYAIGGGGGAVAGGASGAVGTGGVGGSNTSFTGPTVTVTGSGGGAGGGGQTSGTTFGGTWGVSAGANQAVQPSTPGSGGGCIAAFLSVPGAGPVGLGGGGGGAGGIVSGGKGGGGGGAGTLGSSGTSGTAGGSATTAGGTGASAAANTGAGGGGGGCGDAATGGTSGAGGSGYIVITGPYPAN